MPNKKRAPFQTNSLGNRGYLAKGKISGNEVVGGRVLDPRPGYKKGPLWGGKFLRGAKGF